MVESIVTFLLTYKYIILFYLFVALFLFIRRQKLDVQAKVILLYRMKLGLAWMDHFAKKFREWVILLGYIGVGAGYIGLVFISYILIRNLVDLFTKPEAISGVSLVLPGVNVPGLGVLPFWYWILAIFVIALVHEFAHGIVARAHTIEVKNTGLVFFGPILGAFVEPNEKKLRGEKDIVQYSVLAAGSFANILLAFVAIALLSFVFTPLQEKMVVSTGFTFEEYVNPDLPFAQAGIAPQTLITGLNGVSTKNFQEFSEELQQYRPGQEVTVMTKGKEYTLALAKNPDNPKKPYLGIKNIKNELETKEKYAVGGWSVFYFLIEWLQGFFRWLFLLSLGIGLFNLLPLPIVDGGRMAQVLCHKVKGPEQGEKRYRQISLLFLLILVLNLLFPLITKLF